MNGVEKLLTLGKYPDVSLKRAREKRDDARKLVADNVDPSAKRQAERTAQADTFGAIATEWLNLHKPPWAAETVSILEARVKSYLLPYLGSRSHFFTQLPAQAREQFLNEGRVVCYCQYAFPEALDRLRANYSRVEFFAAHVFGDDVRVLDPLANLFETDEDRIYARDILLQLGRELTPQNPLGWGEMGALVAFHNTTPNNTLPIFWSYGKVNDVQWKPLFPRA